MGINMTGMSSGSTTPSPNQGASLLNLNKGDLLNLTKKNPGLIRIKAGLAWDEPDLGGPFDLDLSAFLLGSNRKCPGVDHVIYFNNETIPYGIKYSGDKRNGDAEGDDEFIELDLTKIPPHINEIVFVATIFEAFKLHQNFGMVKNAMIVLYNGDNDKHLVQFNLTDDNSTNTAQIFASVVRNGNEWDFRAIGEGSLNDLNGLAGKFF
jgi:Uncharacterized proteins involved in stress response, homologs of TerZ and putative cAMP-binding protein CABP1